MDVSPQFQNHTPAVPARTREVPGPLFHGTSVPLKEVLPAVVHGGHSTWGRTGSEQGQPSEEHAFATSDEEHAWHFGRMGARGARAHVYTVAPHPDMKPGVHTNLNEYVAPSFKVLDRIDVMPGRQGTLAGNGERPYNWNQHRNEARHNGDANHPPPGEGPPQPGYQQDERDKAITAAQERDHAVFKNVVQTPGQQMLPLHVDASDYGDVQRAMHHDVRHLVANGLTQAPQINEEKAIREWDRSSKARTRERMYQRSNLRWGG